MMFYLKEFQYLINSPSLLHIAKFDKNIVLPLLVLETLRFTLFVFFSFIQYDNIVLIYFLFILQVFFLGYCFLMKLYFPSYLLHLHLMPPYLVLYPYHNFLLWFLILLHLYLGNFYLFHFHLFFILGILLKSVWFYFLMLFNKCFILFNESPRSFRKPQLVQKYDHLS